MKLIYSIKRAAVVVGILALVSITAVAQESRSEISVQGTGFFTKTPTETGFGNTRPTPVDFWLAIATTSIVGLQQRRTTDMTAIRRFISAGRGLA